MRLRYFVFLATLALPAVLPAAARDYRAYGTGYRNGLAVPTGYGGFAQPLIQGDYIGAPFTSVPRPSQIVPTPWSYGTYGIPTVSGIAAPPTGAPTLTVIHAPSGRKTVRQPALAAGDDPADVRVVNVSVPRR